jgi:transposase
MADNNPLRGAYLTCSNEMRRLVVRASVVNNQNNSLNAENYQISKRTVQRILEKFHRTELTDKLPRGGNKPFK